MDCRLVYNKTIDTNNWTIIVFSDASLNNLPNGGTQAGHIIFLRQPMTFPCLLGWKSQKLRRIVRNTICGETIACVDSVDAAYLCQCVLKEILDVKMPIKC